MFSFPVPEQRVPRSCVLGKGGYDTACTMGLSCPSACIAVTAPSFAGASLRGTRPFAKNAKERSTHFAGRASEVKGLGHPPMGKGVQFLSLNNLANNITSLKTWAEWTALPALKMLTLAATNNLSQAIGNTEFLSVTGGASTVVTAPTAAGIETTEAVGGELAPLAILGATVTDMRVQAHCEGFDVPMGIRGPG